MEVDVLFQRHARGDLQRVGGALECGELLADRGEEFAVCRERRDLVEVRTFKQPP